MLYTKISTSLRNALIFCFPGEKQAVFQKRQYRNIAIGHKQAKIGATVLHGLIIGKIRIFR